MSGATGREPSAPAIGTGALAIVDQFLFVGASSVMVFLLGRALDAAEYGGFVLAYSTFLLLGQAQTALFAEPMAVFAPSRYAGRAAGYVRAVERLNLRAGLLAGLALLAVAGVLAASAQRAASTAFLGAGLAAPALLAMWLRRRTLYLDGRVARSAVASAAFFVAGLGALWALHRAGVLNALTGMLALGAASLVGLLASQGAVAARGDAPSDVVRTHWDYGRWALLTALFGWCGNLYYFVLPLRHGLESAAELRALMNFVYPMIQANQAITLVLLPRWAAHGTRAALARPLAWLAAGWAAFALAACAALYAGAGWLVHTVYAGRYDAVAGLLPWVFLLVLPDGVASAIANGLRAARAPRRVAEAAIAIPFVAVLPGIPLTWWAGTRGAIAALLLASLVQLALLWRGWRRPDASQP